MKNFTLILALILASAANAQDRVTGKLFATRSEVISQNAMAATSHPLATLIALQIMREGGNAVDAAIGANAALGLMEPTGSGIGGDIFVIIWDAKTEKLYGLNGSGRSPENLNLAYFQQNEMEKIPSYGPLPVSVPGCVDGWFTMHERFGSMEMTEILNPAITYAENGFPVPQLISYYMSRAIPYYISKGYPNVKEVYTINGEVPGKGDVFKNPYLAKTYRQIAKAGREVFYEGEIARSITTFVQEQGGFLSMEDMSKHKSEWVQPVSVNYRGYDVWELPPNGQGISSLQMLQILKAYEFSPEEYGSPRHLHLVTEAKKLAFEDRARYYADPDFVDIPVSHLISEEYAAERRKLIDEKRAGSYAAGEISAGETVYLTVADSEGNMVSLIQSNYRGMGSGMVPPGLGFMLQNRGELFSLMEGQANTYAPGKRPFHTIIPAFVTKDAKPFMSFGVMGGDFQPHGHVQILMNIIDFKMNLQEAGDAYRFDHDGSSSPTGEVVEGTGVIHVESGITYDTIRALMAMGHKVGFARGTYGGYQAIMWDDERKVYTGASESRKDGMAAGF